MWKAVVATLNKHQLIAAFCIDLHRRNSEQLGLLPKDRMAEYVERGQVFTVSENQELCGYLIAGMTAPWARVWQACVEYDLRGLGHGRELVAQLAQAARLRGCSGITLRCRDGLASNWFWSALGFVLIRSVPGGKRRGKPLNVWAMRIGADLFDVPDAPELAVLARGAGRDGFHTTIRG